MASQVLSKEAEFHEIMMRTYKEAAKLGYRATYFLQMIGELGAVETAKQLVNNAKHSDGFTQLYLLKRLDLSAEALILRDEFRELFSNEDLVAAKKKLNDLNYPVI